MADLSDLSETDKGTVRMGLHLLLAVHSELDSAAAPNRRAIERLLRQVESGSGRDEGGPSVTNSINGPVLGGQVTQAGGDVSGGLTMSRHRHS